MYRLYKFTILKISFWLKYDFGGLHGVRIRWLRSSHELRLFISRWHRSINIENQVVIHDPCVLRNIIWKLETSGAKNFPKLQGILFEEPQSPQFRRSTQVKYSSHTHHTSLQSVRQMCSTTAPVAACRKKCKAPTQTGMLTKTHTFTNTNFYSAWFIHDFIEKS